MRRSTKELCAWAEELGWSWSRTKSGHLRFDRQGCGPVFTSFTPSDHRSYKNTKALLLRKVRAQEATA